MARRPMGRPPKYNSTIHKSICQSLEAGMSRTTAAELVGINRETLTIWQNTYPSFSADTQAAIAKAKARATVTITRAIQNGDVQASFRYLSLREREEWAERASVDVKHFGRVDHVHRVPQSLHNLTNEELEALEAIATKAQLTEHTVDS